MKTLQSSMECRWIRFVLALVLFFAMTAFCVIAPAEEFQSNGIPVLYLHIDGGEDARPADE